MFSLHVPFGRQTCLLIISWKNCCLSDADDNLDGESLRPGQVYHLVKLKGSKFYK